MKTTDWLSEPQEEPSPADCGWRHIDDLPDISHCEDMLEGVVEAVYKTGDIAKLEDCLDELVHQFGIKLPENQPILEKRTSVRSNCTLESWLNFNHGYNESLRNQTTR